MTGTWRAARADELLVERKYRISAREVNVDLVRPHLRAEGDASLIYDDTIRLEAQEIDADLEQQTASATGDVRVSQNSNVLLARSIQYDLAKHTGVLSEARGEAQGVYFTAQSLNVTPAVLTLTEGSFTTCDRAEPHYRVTAPQIILRPGDRLIARHAALWYGRRRLLRLPTWNYSLAEGRQSSPLVPSFGVNRRDGPFGGLRYALLSARDASAVLDVRYTSRRAIRALAHADRRYAWGDLSASLARRGDLAAADLGLFAPEQPLTTITLDRVPEVTLALNPFRLGRWVEVRARAAAGWYREEPSRVRAARGVGDLYLQGRPIKLSSNLSLSPVLGARGVIYDTHQRRSALAHGALVDFRSGPDLHFHLGYLQRKAYGAGPFVFDAFDLSRELDVGVAARLRPGWRIEVLARRDLERGTFPALDIGVTRVAHCLEYGFTYRKVTQEFGVRFGLAQTAPVHAPGWYPWTG